MMQARWDLPLVVSRDWRALWVGGEQTQRQLSTENLHSGYLSGIGVIANLSEVGLVARVVATTALSCKVNDLSMSSTSTSSTISPTSESSSESGNESSWLLSKKETLSLTRLKL